MTRKKRCTGNNSERKNEKGSEANQKEKDGQNVTPYMVTKPNDSNPTEQSTFSSNGKQPKLNKDEAATGEQDDKHISKDTPSTAVTSTSVSKEPVTFQGQDNSIRLSGITSFGAALHNVLNLIERIIPERYRSKLTHIVALVIVFIVLACVAWKFRHILLGVPDIYITVINRSDQVLPVPQYVRAKIIDHTGQEIDGYPMQMIHSTKEEDKDKKIHLRFPKNKTLYQAYEEGNVYLALQFFLDPSYEELRYVSKRFLFSKKGLRPWPIILDSDLYLDEPGIYVFFETDPNTKPDYREKLKSDMEELEKAARDMFWVTTRSKYKQVSEKIESIVKKNNPSMGIENLALRDQANLTMVRITILGYIKIGSHMKWVFDLNETKKRMRDVRVSVDCGPNLTKIAKQKILDELQQTIVDFCGIKGTVFEIIKPSNKEDNYVATLDIGSFMGVQEGMEFIVLSKGTANLRCGKVEIIKVTPKSKWGAKGIITIETEELNEFNYTKYEDYNIERLPKRKL